MPLWAVGQRSRDSGRKREKAKAEYPQTPVTGRREAPTPKCPFWAVGTGCRAVAEVTQVTILGYRAAKQREQTEEKESKSKADRDGTSGFTIN